MCVKVRMCEISHVRTFTHISKKFFAKKKLRQPHHARCTHFARVRVCGCAKFRTSAHPHACKMCATCMVWLPEFCFAKKFLEMCVKVRMCEISHVRTPARVQNVCNVHGVAARGFFCKKKFGYVCESADVRNFAHPHFHTHIQKFFCKKNLWQPHHAHCTHFASVRVCGRAKFRTSALSHTFPNFFFQKKKSGSHTMHIAHILHACESADVRNFAHPHFHIHFQKFFCKKNSGSHTMHIAHILHACGCADVRIFAHPHFHTHFQKFFCKTNPRQPHHARCTHFARVRVWLSEFCFAKKFLEMCVKVRMCEISHVRTPARVQNVCNVHGVAARVFFCKKNFGYVCESADVRNFAHPHTRTRAKCVQCAWCGCQSFVLQKNFWKCV